MVNQAENSTEDLFTDLMAVVCSVCAQLYGQHWAKHKAEVIVCGLEKKGKSDATG